jgi:asparagine synthase (glutamine-hydrolysing)
VIRSAAVPLYLLARSTREQGITVVATGEGADELYWGYDLFKEAKLRAFCARDPEAAWRASLFDRLYPYFAASGGRRGETWRRFFLDAGSPNDPLFSHQTRVAATAGVKALYSGDTRAALREVDPLERLRDDLPEEFGRMSPLERAAYLELTTLLGNHLLAAQADRVGMAHGIEGRFPFLDHRVFENSVATPPHEKLAGMREKLAVRRVAAGVVPPIVAQRPKQPYRAPEASAFFDDEPEWVSERLSSEAVNAVGIYDERAVAGLVRRCRAGRATGFRENMALMGVLSTQVWYETFCEGSMRFPEERGEPRVRLRLGLPLRVGSAA